MEKVEVEKNIFQELFEQFKTPWKYNAFRLYFPILVIGFGCTDIWVSVYEYFTTQAVSPHAVSAHAVATQVANAREIYPVTQNISGFFVALIAASTVDLWTSLAFRNMLSLAFLSFGIIGLATILYLVCYFQHGPLGFFLSLVGAVLGLVVWIIANSAEDKWSDSNFYAKMRGADTQHTKGW